MRECDKMGLSSEWREAGEKKSDVTIWGHTLLLLRLRCCCCVKGKAPAFEASRDRCDVFLVGGTKIIPEFMQQDNVVVYYYDFFAGDVTEKGCTKQSERSSERVLADERPTDLTRWSVPVRHVASAESNRTSDTFSRTQSAAPQKKDSPFLLLLCFVSVNCCSLAPPVHFPFHSFIRVSCC